MHVICPTCQVACEASMPAACYFAWGCFRYFVSAHLRRRSFSNVTRNYAGKGAVRYALADGDVLAHDRAEAFDFRPVDAGRWRLTLNPIATKERPGVL